MRNPFRPLTESGARFRTSISLSRAEEAVQSVRDFEADARKERRLNVCECRACHYIYSSRFGGCAMTAWHCGLCGKEDLAGSTNTPRVCQDCGKKHSICTHCGGDLDMRDRRRKWPTPVDHPATSGRRGRMGEELYVFGQADPIRHTPGRPVVLPPTDDRWTRGVEVVRAQLIANRQAERERRTRLGSQPADYSAPAVGVAGFIFAAIAQTPFAIGLAVVCAVLQWRYWLHRVRERADAIAPEGA